VAWELHRAGIAVRWVNTHGEQAHGKFVLIQRTDGSASLVSGSANLPAAIWTASIWKPTWS